MSYCDIHRAVLQLMMHKGAIEEQEALKTVQDLARKLSPAGLGESDIPTEPTTLKKFFDVINKETGPEGINWAVIKHIKIVATDQVYWQKEATLLHVKNSANLGTQELETFKDIVKKLVTEPVMIDGEGTLEENVCINIGMNRKLSSLESTRCIDKLISDGWLRAKEHDRGQRVIKRITLGTRSVFDLRRWVRGTWERDDALCEWKNDWKFEWGRPEGGAPQGIRQAGHVGDGGHAGVYSGGNEGEGDSDQ